MSNTRQIILDCNSPGQANCVLAPQSAPAIQLNNRASTGQYRYYLQINNHGEESCQLSMKLDEQSELDLLTPSLIIVSIRYQQKLLFEGFLNQALSETIILHPLSPHAKDLYQLDWQIDEISPPWRFNFALDFSFDCVKPDPSQSSAQVLGQQSVDATLLDDHQAKPLLFCFGILLLLIFVFIAVKLLTSSKKGSSHEPEKNS